MWDADDVALAGGKAVGLGGLIEAGLPVPPGFVLTTAAYSRFRH
jgi:phosphoenolpyruvate synthase/pyruvate phosphate dikinase